MFTVIYQFEGQRYRDLEDFATMAEARIRLETFREKKIISWIERNK